MRRIHYWLSGATVVVGIMLVPSLAQAEGWETVASGVTNDLNSLYMVDDATGYAVGGAPFVGGSGIVLKTTNGGTSWVAQTIPQQPASPGVPASYPPLRGIHCLSVSVCYAAGDNGYLIKTTNGGTIWTLQTVGTASDRPWFWDIHMTSETSGVAVGNVGRIYRTTNGGSTWVSVGASGAFSTGGVTTNNLTDVFFVNSTTGWAIGGGALIKTTDGGASWFNQSGATAAGGGALFFIDATTGWKDPGPWRISKTTNGGATWVEYDTGTPWGFSGLYFTSATNGFGVSIGGILRKTTTGGTSWTEESSGTGQILRDIKCATTKCLAVGDDGVIIRTTLGSASAGSGSGTSASADTIAPSVPTGLAVTTPLSDLTPTFVWNQATDNVGVTRYEVMITDLVTNQMHFGNHNIFGATSLTYTLIDRYSLVAGRRYAFKVRAKDAADNASAYAMYEFETAAVLAGDTSAPTTPTGLAITSGETDATPTFIWNAATDNVGVTAYEVNFTNNITMVPVVATTNVGNVLTYTVPDTAALMRGMSHSFTVKAIDAAGNRGAAALIGVVIENLPAAADTPATPDTTPPGRVMGLSVTSENSDLTPSFAWSAATDNVAVASYDIRLFDVTRSTDVIPTTNIGNTRTYTLPSAEALIVSREYAFYARAVDAAGNRSTSWSSVIFTVRPEGYTPPADAVVPGTPSNLRRTTATTDPRTAFSWDAATDNVGVTGYDIRLFNMTRSSDVLPTTDAGATLTYIVPSFVTLTTGPEYVFYVRAKDAAGNTGAWRSLVFTVQPSANASSDPSSSSLSDSDERETAEEEPAEPERPDLEVEPTRLTANRLQFKVKNRGSQTTGNSTTGGFHMRFEWLNRRGVWMSNPRPLVVWFPNIAGGGGGVATRTYDTNSATVNGTNMRDIKTFISRPPQAATKLRLTIDIDDRQEESNEENNVADISRSKRLSRGLSN